MSDAIDETAYIGSDFTMASIVAPNEEQERRKKERQQTKEQVMAALVPAAAILKEMNDREITNQSDLSSYERFAQIDSATTPNVLIEMQAEIIGRRLYKKHLNRLNKLIEDTLKKNGGASND